MLAALYSEVNILCILFLLLIYFKIKAEPYMQMERCIFLRVLISNCIFFALDALWIFVDSSSFSIAVQANWVLNVFYFVTSGVVSYIWFIYSETIQESSLVKDKRHRLICAIPLILLALLSIISIKTGWLFYIDSFNNYYRGSLYPIQLICSYGYLLFTAVKALFLSRKAVGFSEKNKYRSLAVFILPTLIAGIIQVMLPGISILCVGTTFGILYIFTTMQEQLISSDSLTGLNNRNRMMRHLADRIEHYDEGNRLYLIMMDLDFFKQINDRFGHVEGDSALRKTAEVLKRCCENQHNFIARYGGDEFAIICQVEAEWHIEDLCKDIKKEMSMASRECPYELSLSIGYAEYNRSIKTDIDLIKAADAELYKAKKAR